VEEQVVVIYAGVNGYLDAIDTARVGAFEQGLLELVHGSHSAILEDVRETKALSENTEAALKKVVDEYAASFA
jgi:F-type H+-transporting ATPase subunit alpha